jgi:putative phosphoribosyl transferase
VVVGLPRGGVEVAFEVARALGAPLDVIVVRRLGVPTQPELAMGALGEDGIWVLDREVTGRAGVTDETVAAVVAVQRAELERRVRRFRAHRPARSLAGRTVIVVDDGVATGSTGRVACQVARAQGAYQVVLAVPVAPRESAQTLGIDADEVVCLEYPDWFIAVGEFYAQFPPVTDDEVLSLLDRTAGTSA